MSRRDFPRVHFYDQDFVDIYDKTWSWVSDSIANFYNKEAPEKLRYLMFNNGSTLELIDQVFASFFLVYSNRIYSASSGLDALYTLQDESGAIHAKYDLLKGKAQTTRDNPDGLTLPLLSWAEFNLYHKTANKKRVKEVVPFLQKHWSWLDKFKAENGLYATPLAATMMENAPRGDGTYFIDFNAAMALNALYLSALLEILNDKEGSFQYKKAYFSLKTRINSQMWNAKEGFYFDLDKAGRQLKVRTLAAYWPLIAEIPNEDKAEKLVVHLRDPQAFGTEHPFPSLEARHKQFDPRGMGYRGSVFPYLTYMVIKGLEKYNQYELARNSAIRHLYFVLDSMHTNEVEKENSRYRPNKNEPRNAMWEAYQPMGEGKALWPDKHGFPRANHLALAGLSTVALMIENIIGLSISLPRKTVDWMIPNLEVMGIENLALKRNYVTILSNKSGRGWEIRMESEKLYYFTISVPGKKKTLPIPSGKCSLLIDKI